MHAAACKRARPAISEDAVFALATAESGVQAHTGGKETVRKRIYVPDKLLNLVVS